MSAGRVGLARVRLKAVVAERARSAATDRLLARCRMAAPCERPTLARQRLAVPGAGAEVVSGMRSTPAMRAAGALPVVRGTVGTPVDAGCSRVAETYPMRVTAEDDKIGAMPVARRVRDPMGDAENREHPDDEARSTAVDQGRT